MKNELEMSADQAREIVYDDREGWRTVETRIIEATRWSIVMEGVFERSDGTFWIVTWCRDATEMQEEKPFEGEDEVTFQRVEKKMVTVEKWIEVS